MRRGLGRGKGKGYYNLVARDPYIHSLSAKGVKSRPDYRRYDIYRFTRHAETPPDEEYGQELVEAETIVTPVSEREEFGEYMADEYGYQDYSNIVNFKEILSNVSGEVIQELCDAYEKEASKLDAKEHISKELFEEKLQTAVSNDERLEVLRSYRPLYAIKKIGKNTYLKDGKKYILFIKDNEGTFSHDTTLFQGAGKKFFISEIDDPHYKYGFFVEV